MKKSQSYGNVALKFSVATLIVGFVLHFIGWVVFAIYVGYVFACGLTPLNDGFC